MVRPVRLEVRAQPDRARPTLAVDGELDLSSVPLVAPQHDSATLVLRMTGADRALPFEDQPLSGA
jgi:hypothetical protein